MHGLRHTRLSASDERNKHLGCIKRLGHASVDITLGVYAHLLKELEDRENDKIKSELDKII